MVELIDLDDIYKEWLNIWENECDEIFNNRFLNIRFLVRCFLDEYKCNKFGSPAYRNFFKDKLNFLLNSDPVLKKDTRLHPYFSVLANEIDKDCGSWNFYYVCRSAEEILFRGYYFEDCLDMLLKLLKNGDLKNEIPILNRNLILEFFIIGYDLKNIRKIPTVLFVKNYDNISINSIFEISFPLSEEEESSFKDIKTEDVRDFLKKKLVIGQKFLDALKAIERVERLGEIFKKRVYTEYFIFKVNGLKGRTKLEIGDVTFYSPFEENFIKETSGLNLDETFGLKKPEFKDGKKIEKSLKEDESDCFINAAVLVKHKFYESGKKIAIEKIEKALDIISCYFIGEVVILTDFYLRVNLQKKEIGSGSNYTNLDWYKRKHAHPLEQIEQVFGNYIDHLKSKVLDAESEVAKRIKYSLHWNRKGKESVQYEDKILFSWISIENLLNSSNKKENFIFGNKDDKRNESTLSISKEIIFCLEISKFIENRFWNIYKEIDSHKDIFSEKTKNNFSLRGNIITLKVEFLLQDLGVFKDELINSNKFISKDREILLKLLSETELLFTDRDNYLKNLKIIKEKVDYNCEIISWYRNKIVHNAYMDTTFLPYFAKESAQYSKNILQYALKLHVVDNMDNLEKCFAYTYARTQKMWRLVKDSKIPVCDVVDEYLDIKYSDR